MNSDEHLPDPGNQPEEISRQQESPETDPIVGEKPSVHDSPRSFVPWPPPGLEQVQGALLPAAGFLSLGGVILVLPLLLSVGTYNRFWNLGPFGSDVWIVAVTSAIGITIIAESLNRLFRLLRTGNLAVKQGHGWLTVIQTIADSSRDNGFLLQGARIYSALEPQKRSSLLLCRLLAVGLFLAAAIWLVLGFLIAIFLGARGVFGTAALWYFTLIPVLLLLVGAYSCRVRTAFAVKSLVKKLKETVEEEVGTQIGNWVEKADGLESEGVLGRGPSSRAMPVRISFNVVLIFGMILLVPVMF